MTRPLVLVINHFAQPRSSAGGTRHVEMFGQLARWDHRIVAARLSYLDQKPLASEGAFRALPVSRFRGNGTSRVLSWATFSCSALVAGTFGPKPDVVYGSSPHMGAALAGWLVSKIRRAEFVLEVRDLWPHILAESGMLSDESTLYRALKALERFLYKRASRIVILAEGSAEYIANEGVAPHKIVFVPNGADPSSFSVVESRDSLRSRQGFEGFCVVYAGAHGPANGLNLVLDAAEKLQGTPAVFHLVGAGVAKTELMRDADSRRLTNVHFHDPVPKERIPEVFAASDAGLHCLADHDLFTKGVSPNKLYDYMAAGLPVITNTRGEVASIVEEAGSGFAVGPCEIADAVTAAMDSQPERLASMGQSGREWMDEHRSRAAMAGRIEALLDEVVA